MIGDSYRRLCDWANENGYEVGLTVEGMGKQARLARLLLLYARTDDEGSRWGRDVVAWAELRGETLDAASETLLRVVHR